MLERLIRSVVGAAFEVANTLGHGFVETVYQQALAHELHLRGIPAQREVRFDVSYKGCRVGVYVADLVVDDMLIVELKSVEQLIDAHVGQILNYLKASGRQTGLLINFGQPKVIYRRVNYSRPLTPIDVH